ncbi:GDSL-type esterase/lipase family protein [Ruficoccus sp. ZRK36]|uniref:GDSL-type esterase/lipase family protein n=1 Tax=Ruficoccus sp. ZRK36 TaxID=2866311 RepID=UPI001C72C899|nr:GDSL-type esterase/lipase family protein [Ruficoccus sp. ZRK36]QYY37267.1 hypothetical protein K0V07_07230 [Ruficoccus sp. ZRK36]
MSKTLIILVLLGSMILHLSSATARAEDNTTSGPPPPGSADDPAWGYWSKLSNPNAWLSAHQRLTRAAQAQDAEIVFLGDSITKGWLEQGRSQWDSHYKAMNAIDLGIGGDSTRQILWRLDHGALGNHAPRIIVLMIGTNNILNSKADSVEIIEGIKAIITRIQQLAPGATTLLLSPPPLGAAAKNDRVIDLTQHLAELELPNVVFLDITGAFTDDLGVVDLELYRPDRIHPNAEGYARLDEQLYPSLTRLLSKCASDK